METKSNPGVEEMFPVNSRVKAWGFRGVVIGHCNGKVNILFPTGDRELAESTEVTLLPKKKI